MKESDLIVVSVAEATRILGLSRTTIWRLEMAGDFPRKLQLSPGRIGYSLAELERWAAARGADGGGEHAA